MIARSILILCFFCSTFQIGFAQELILYKEVDTTQLFMEVIYPENREVNKEYPALVFFSEVAGLVVADNSLHRRQLILRSVGWLVF